MIAIVPASSGTPTSANSKKPKPPTPASLPASETSTFTGVPVSASIEPAWAEKTSGISSCEEFRFEPDGDDDHHRQQRGDGAVDADQRGEQRDQAHRQDQKAGPAFLARATDQKLARPRR